MADGSNYRGSFKKIPTLRRISLRKLERPVLRVEVPEKSGISSERKDFTPITPGLNPSGSRKKLYDIVEQHNKKFDKIKETFEQLGGMNRLNKMSTRNLFGTDPYSATIKAPIIFDGNKNMKKRLSYLNTNSDPFLNMEQRKRSSSETNKNQRRESEISP